MAQNNKKPHAAKKFFHLNSGKKFVVEKTHAFLIEKFNQLFKDEFESFFK